MRLFYILVFSGLAAFTQEIYAQCMEPQLVMATNACLDESLHPTNDTPSGAYTFEWDFCAGDLKSFPEVNTLLVNSNFFRARSIRFVQEAGNWHAFSISATGNNLMRLDFGDDLNSVPSLHNLGNIGGALSSAFAFDIIKSDGVWHILVANGGKKNILRLSFFDGVSNSPTPYVLETPAVFDDAGPNFIRIVRELNEFYAFVSVGTSVSNTKIVTLKLASLLDVTPELSAFTVAGSSQLRGLAFFKDCGNWSGFAVSVNTNTLYRLNFENGLMTPPVSSIVDTKGILLNAPVNIELRVEGGVYYAFVQNARIEQENAALYRIAFSDSFTSTVERVDKLQMEALTGGAYALDVVNHNSSWHVFTFNLATQSLLRMDFGDGCAASIPVSYARDVVDLRYSRPGTHDVTLSLTDDRGNFSTTTASVEVSSLAAPDIHFVADNMCADYETTFTSLNQSGDIRDYAWQFGDGIVSEDSNPIHQFNNAETYFVNLSVTASNGCRNFFSKTIKMYDSPSADFTMPSNVLCTNNEIVFINDTPDAYEGNLTYQWYVDDLPAGVEQDLRYTFTSIGAKEIRLKASLPGCFDEMDKTTTDVKPGPVLDFSLHGICEDEASEFSFSSSTELDTLLWDFGDGGTSTNSSPYYVFTEAGEYVVSFTATSPSGCVATKTKNVSVYATPIVDFVAYDAPYACIGADMFFENASHSLDGQDFASWEWIYGEGAMSTDVNGTHNYIRAGTYPVSLTATTTAGCVGTLEKDITIHPSPSTEFNYTPLCEDIPVLFTAPPDPLIQSSYWEFGTSYSNDASPTHTFAAPGDYRLYAEFYGSNGCISTIEKTLQVPVPLTPDFSFIKNCVDHEAIFTDITNSTDATRTWDFGDGLNPTSSTVSHLFTQQATVPVTLRVTTPLGCSYATTRQVEILPSPVAQFSASPETGAYPLDVMFTNTSRHADQFQWEFLDGTGNTSGQESPAYTFSTLGTFDVTLTAHNAQQCGDSFTKSITTVAPLPDADIEMIQLVSQPDGSTKLIITIHNKGNTILRDLPMAFDFSGNVSLSQTVSETIMPGAQYNFVLNSAILDAEKLAFLCVSLDVQNDVSPDGNRSCSAMNADLFVFPVYPNPAADGVRLEWLSSASQTVTVSLTDAVGRTIFRQKVAGTAGRNSHLMDLQALPVGLYLLIVDDGASKSLQRISVER